MTDGKDYVVEVKIKNGPMKRAMAAAGIASVAELSRQSGVAYGSVLKYLTLQRTPFVKGDVSPNILKIAFVLKKPVEELFPPQHLNDPLLKNSASFDLSLEEVAMLTSDTDMEESVHNRLLIDTLSRDANPRNVEALRMRYGLPPYKDEHTAEDIAERFGVSKGRVHQMIAKAERSMRNKSEKLKVSGW